MAHVIITLKIMPESPDVNLEVLEATTKEMIEKFGASYKDAAIEPVAFGLKSLNPTFSMDEDLGDTEELEKQIEDLEDVASVQVTSCSRAMG